MKSAIEKLARLREIQTTLNDGSYSTTEAPLLHNERDRILASVALPPMDLIGRGNCEEWATAFAVAFPQFDLDTARIWFTHAMACGEYAGVELGLAQGMQTNNAAPLAELLRTIRGTVPGLGARRVITNGETTTLAEHINRVLNAAGFEA